MKRLLVIGTPVRELADQSLLPSRSRNILLGKKVCASSPAMNGHLGKFIGEISVADARNIFWKNAIVVFHTSVVPSRDDY